MPLFTAFNILWTHLIGDHYIVGANKECVLVRAWCRLHKITSFLLILELHYAQRNSISLAMRSEQTKGKRFFPSATFLDVDPMGNIVPRLLRTVLK